MTNLNMQQFCLLLCSMQERTLPEKIKVEHENEISEQGITTTLKRAALFYSTIQAEDGHWAGDYGGPMFLLPGLVRLNKNRITEETY